MFRFLDLWGFSYRHWTPALLRLRQLTDENARAPNPAAFTRSFQIRPHRNAVFEFRTLNETWTWEPAKSSLLMPPDALEFFLHSVNMIAEPAPASSEEETAVFDPSDAAAVVSQEA